MAKLKNSTGSQKLRKKIVEKICPECPSFGDDHSCSCTDFGEGCAAMHFLPEIVELAARLKKKNLKQFKAGIDKAICSQCQYVPEQGVCEIEKSCQLRRSLKTILSLTFSSVRATKKK